MNRLAYLIEESDEVVVASAQAAANPYFGQLGLTDAALLESISPQTPLLTVDGDLYVAALAKGENEAVNFRQFMERASVTTTDKKPQATRLYEWRIYETGQR